jgi:PAS domain S-box-containing protein
MKPADRWGAGPHVPDSPRSATRRASGSLTPVPGRIRRPVHVLLVEDEAAQARLLREYLGETETPPRIHESRTLAQAATALSEQRFDVAIVDLQLPDSAGANTVAHLLEIQPDLAVVVLTGNRDEALRAQIMALGVYDFLVKDDVDGHLLRRSTNYAIDSRAMRAELERAWQHARASEDNFRNAVHHSGEGVLVVDDGGTVRVANPAAALLLGRAAQDLIGRPSPVPIEEGSRALVLRQADGAPVHVEARVLPIQVRRRSGHLICLFDQTDRERLEDIHLVQRIQRSFQPARSSAAAGRWSVAASNDLCRDASGDYCDFIPLGKGRLAVAIGDVAGHGLGAALVMVNARAFLRAYLGTLPTLALAMEHVNESLVRDLSEGRFMSLFVAILDPEASAIEWCNAGHVPPWLRRKDASVDRLAAGGPVLGIEAGVAYRAQTSALAPGDVMLLCTDGLTEARDESGMHFGAERVEAALHAVAHLRADDLVERLRETVDTWTSRRPLADDLTLVAVTGAETP